MNKQNADLKKTRNILIFPGGTEIGLEIYHSLKDCKNIKLFSAANDVPNHAAYVFKNHFIVPGVHEADWLSALDEIIVKHDIHYVFPANDTILNALIDNLDHVRAEVISSPRTTCLLTKSKSLTYKKFKNSLPVPRVFQNITEIESFPVFVKPDVGYGSQGAMKIENLESLKGALAANPNLLVLEYLDGPEYTVDCFTDRRKGLLFCSGRERRRIRMGTSMRGGVVDNNTNKLFNNFAKIITDQLQFFGAWYFQMKKDSHGQLKLLEIAPRIAGTMALHRALGVNFPLLTIYEREGIDIQIMTNEMDDIEIDRALINRYQSHHRGSYNTIYVDFDDTIITNGKINLDLIKFLYQGVNQGCKIILLTKCLTNIHDHLERWKIKNLFDEVLWIKEEESKADYIKPEGAIFIDDSFSQRQEVFKRHGISTFDVSMVESLMDERV